MFFNSPSAEEEAVLATSFCYPDRRFLWSRLKLFDDRIEFLGFGWNGRYRRTLPLDTLKAVHWLIGQRTVNLVLHRHEGHPLPLHVASAGLWKHRIEARAGCLEEVDRPLRARSSRAAAE